MGGPACQEAIQIRLCLLPLLGALIGFWIRKYNTAVSVVGDTLMGAALWPANFG